MSCLRARGSRLRTSGGGVRARGISLAALIAALAVLVPAAAQAHGIADVVPDIPTGGHVAHATGAHPAAALDYEGGPVLHSNRTHLLFWQPSGSGLSFDAGYEAVMERFLALVAADSHRTTNVYALTGQYFDSGGPAAYASSYAGAVVDGDPLPANGCTEPPATGPGWAVCLTDAQLQQELEHVVSARHLARGADDIYVLVLPNGLGTCTDSTSQSCALGGSETGYCGYHSETPDGLLYDVIPYNAVAGHCQSGNPRPNGSTADPALSTVSHEQMETITDPETYGSWIDPRGNEMADLCISNFGPRIGGSGARAWNEVIHGGHYWLQEEWSNVNNSCQPRAQNDAVSFGAPARIQAGKKLTLSGHGRDPHGAIIAYSWSFGDGAGSRRRITSHSFRRPGLYKITLRVTDSAENWGFATRTIRVLPVASRRRATAKVRRR